MKPSCVGLAKETETLVLISFNSTTNLDVATASNEFSN